MVVTRCIVLVAVAVAAASSLFYQFLKPNLDIAGFFLSVEDLNNEKCEAVEALQGCEDMYLHRESGIAYLPCTPPTERAHWTPAMLRLNRENIPYPSGDYIATFDTKTRKHQKLELTNLPAHIIKYGLHLHAIDLFIQHGKSEATIFVNNHRPPANVAAAAWLGADSVIELFATELGSGTARYIGTVQHSLVNTPNSLIALSANSFYVSNDHADRISFLRHIEPFLPSLVPKAGIIYCSVENGFELPDCFVATTGYPHPNGLAKGPGDSLYLATTFEPTLRSFEIQADHSLVLVDQVKLPRAVDNIHVSPSGAVYLATIPKLLKFVETTKAPLLGKIPGIDVTSPTEVWRVSNGTGLESYHGGRLKVEKVFGDGGSRVSSATTALAHGGKLYITGLTSPWLSICKVDSQFAT